ncbi:hypothetical protein N826_31230 [Skermanella aerolata KACC 11604]|nr:hypothetical protein N826_31230 [Skermanella aerolata KACC 11604]
MDGTTKRCQADIQPIGLMIITTTFLAFMKLT